jgi:hypothetical protein
MKIVPATFLLLAAAPILLSGRLQQAASQTKPATQPEEKGRRFIASETFDFQRRVIFRDDFQSGLFDRWSLSEDDRYGIARENPDRLQILNAPGLGEGRKAVRFRVPRAANSFRSEISLPSERSFNERWYSERMLVPAEWVFDSGKGNDIVMQWHAIPGNGKPTYPNLEFSVGDHSWFIRQSYGTARETPTRTSVRLDDPVQPGKWVSWVVHARWSAGPEGLVQIWKDGKVVLEHKGANVYTDIGVEYTPYLKTGIYHPEWHLDTQRKRDAFEKENPISTLKIIYVTDVKVGSEKATFDDMSPSP